MRNEIESDKMNAGCLAACIYFIGERQKKEMKVLNFGSMNIDYVYQLPHIVKPGETITATRLDVNDGGKGLNQSIAMRRAGIEVYHAGMVGSDGAGLLETCRANGIHTEHIQTVSVRTGNAIIQVNEEGQNCIVLFPGANRANTKEHVDEVLSHFGAGDVLVLQNEINLLDYLVDRAYEKGMIIAMNPSPFDQAVLDCDLTKVTYFFVNEIEGEMLTGEKEPEKIMDQVLAKYPKSRLILTLGSDGAWYSDENGRFHQEICKVKAVDTTAAGDTFSGYFLSAILKEKTPQEALKMATVASGIAVSRPGATASVPTVEEVEQEMARRA